MSHHVPFVSDLSLAVRLTVFIGMMNTATKLLPHDLPLRTYIEGRREVVLPLMREARRQALDGTLIRPYAAVETTGRSLRRRLQDW